jgi:hypothetical protein
MACTKCIRTIDHMALMATVRSFTSTARRDSRNVSSTSSAVRRAKQAATCGLCSFVMTDRVPEVVLRHLLNPSSSVQVVLTLLRRLCRRAAFWRRALYNMVARQSVPARFLLTRPTFPSLTARWDRRRLQCLRSLLSY